jgi:hypothetical protein
MPKKEGHHQLNRCSNALQNPQALLDSSPYCRDNTRPQVQDTLVLSNLDI